MSRPGQVRNGFTLVELMVVVAVIAILGALAWTNMSRARPRANLATATGELQAFIHAARLQALASGHDVAVVVFPKYASPGGGTGRVVVVEDATFDFFTAGAKPNLDDYVAATPSAGTGGQVVAVYDLPPGVLVGPVTGRGANTLAVPWDTVAVNVACTFCGGADQRGAIRFDTRGRASFYSKNGVPLAAATGHSLTITGQPTIPGYRTLVISSTGSAVLTFNDG